MNIRTADPHQLEEIALFFKKSFSPENSLFLRKLSYCLARGSCYVLETHSLNGSVLIDDDFLDYTRIVAVQASTEEEYTSLLRHALGECSTRQLFLKTPEADSPLAQASTACGFSSSGEFSLGDKQTSTHFLSARSF